MATRGRALDHIGFEVRNLEAFCRRLEAAGIRLTDPWGTYIELTEGLGAF